MSAAQKWRATKKLVLGFLVVVGVAWFFTDLGRFITDMFRGDR